MSNWHPSIHSILVAMRRLILTLFIVHVAAACGESAPPSESVETVTARPELSIGSVEGTGPDVFGAITGLAIDPDGRIFVSDVQASEIRVFDRDGAFLFQFARHGSGPGEVSGPCCLAFDRDGYLWVRDTGNGRYNRYLVSENSATADRTVRMNHGAGGFYSPTTFDRDGNLIDVGMAPGSAGPEVARYHVDAEGSVVRSVQIPQPSADSVGEAVLPMEGPGGRRGIRYYQQPFGPQHRIAHSPRGDWAKVLTGIYSIEWYDDNDSLLRVVTRDVPPVPISAAEQDSVETQLIEELQRFGHRMADLPWGIPSEKTPVRNIYFDDIGRLWVERNVSGGEERKADVFDVDGELVVTVVWPEDVSLFPSVIGEDFIVAVHRDELGVPSVVRFRLSGEGRVGS